MDFTFEDDQIAVRDLAATLFADRASTDRVREVEASSDRIDRALWGELAATGLLGIALPDSAGGAGLGMTELCLVLEQQGRHVAPVPLWQTATAALTLAHAGSAEQNAAILPAVIDGALLLTVALEEFGPGRTVRPATTAALDGGRWRLTGTKAAVPVGHAAGYALVSATAPSGVGLYLVDLHGPGVVAEQVDTTSHELAAHLILDTAPAQPVGSADGSVLRWLLTRLQLAVSAALLGVAEASVAQGAQYVSTRHQFGRPLGTFQAVQHELADCYIDVEAMRVTLWQAAWLLDRGCETGTATPVAAWWAADSGARVVHRVQHLHGGIGVDIDYPIHRYLLWGKQLSGLLGGPSACLDAVAAELAAAP